MTTKLEKQFFETFGIEERELDYPDNFTYYPDITDRILLELICFFSTEIDYFTCCSSDIETLKEDILTEFIFNNKLIDKQQVQALFKGEESNES